MASRTFWPMSYDEKHFSCVWCEEKFRCKLAVEGHVLKHHKYNCNDCIKEFPKLSDFILHSKNCNFAKKNVLYFIKQYLNYAFCF